MSNNKQSSSIDFFWNQLPEILPFTVGTETAVKLLEAFEQAKAMHKEEVTSFTADWSVQYKYEDGKSINKYYNETFGGGEQ